MDYQLIEKKIEEYVTGLFEQMQTPDLVYHNLVHTKKVVKHTLEIAAHYHISEREMFILIAAAWFHDTGHLYAQPDKHEATSCQILRKFMKEFTGDEILIEEIHACIMATKFPRNPGNLLQEIICDADTYQFGTKNFKNTNKRVCEEVRRRTGETDPVKFRHETIQLLKTHVYYTSYCKDRLDAGKKKNLKQMEKKEDQTGPETGTLSDLQKDKSDLMGKGIQTMLRLTSANHLKLSEMADRKANILISVNAIIISVILGVLSRKLQEYTYLVIPTIIFLTVAVIVIVLSILATRPKISGGSFTLSEVKAKKTNLLFFGNFYNATYEEYNEAMKEMMLDTNYLYNCLIKDIYSLGVVLGRKYRLIRLAYNVFMIGIILSVLAFSIAIFIAGR